MTAPANFRTVKDAVLRRISEGQYAPGALLPIETELAREFSCARATVNRAMRELAEDGIIDRKRRAGSRVNAHPIRNARLSVPLVRIEVAEKGAVYRYRMIEREICRPYDGLTARMALDAKSKVLRVACMHYADNAPYLYEERWINLDAIPEAGTASFDVTSPNEWLVSKSPLSDMNMSFVAEAASERASSFLEVEAGTPVIAAERQTWLAGASITFARLIYHPGYRVIAHH